MQGSSEIAGSKNETELDLLWIDPADHRKDRPAYRCYPGLLLQLEGYRIHGGCLPHLADDAGGNDCSLIHHFSVGAYQKTGLDCQSSHRPGPF